MPSGTPIAMAMAAAATTSTSVCTVCFQRFWLMMKMRPMKTPMASGRERCNSQARMAMTSASSTGGTISRRSTAPSRTKFRPFEKALKTVSKLSVRKPKKALPHGPIGIL